MKTIFLNKTLLLLVAIFFVSLADIQAQTFPNSGNLGSSRLRVQGDVDKENSYQRGLISQNIQYRLSDDKWVVGNQPYDDFSMMKFNNGGSIGFYTRARTQNNYTMTNAQLESYNRMTITNAGNVGIGTAAPSYKLHVAGSIYSGWVRTAGKTGLYFQSYGGGFRMVDNTWIRTHGNKSFYHNTGIMRTDGTFQVGPAGSRFIVTGGNVGIGTKTPGNKLEVNGTIRAKEVKVELANWGDYVFYDDYQLPTLTEEAAHIEAKGHLLGFESAEDMADELELGDVSKRQQVKIEEMMLHLIDMNKQMATMQAKIDSLEKENTQLKK